MNFFNKMEMEKHIENSKLITLMRAFEKNELKQLAEFLTLPLLKPKPDKATFRLLECIIGAFPDFSSPKLSHAYLQNYCFKSKGDSSSNLNNRMSRLLGHAENFLVFKKLELERGKNSDKAPAIKDHLLLDTLLEREATDYFPHPYNAASKALAERPDDGETYLTHYLLEHDNLRYQHSKAPRLTKADLQPLIDAGDRYFILSKLI